MNTFSQKQLGLLKSMNSACKIQDFLDSIPINFEENGHTLFSPKSVLRYNKAHCVEGALFAAAALSLNGMPPLIVDLETDVSDSGHVIAVYSVNGLWGAMSKTNHAVLRYRDPIYRDIRELVASYFHEYFLDTGKKTLLAYSEPINLHEFDSIDWMTTEKPLWPILERICSAPHTSLVPTGVVLRDASRIEIETGKLTEWKP